MPDFFPKDFEGSNRSIQYRRYIRAPSGIGRLHLIDIIPLQPPTNYTNMGKTLISLMSFPLPLDTVGLGDLINDRKDPRKSFFDHTTLPTKPSPSVSLSDMRNFSDMVKSTQVVDLEASLTRFASVFLRLKARSFDELHSCLVKEYTLSNTDSWYDVIIKEDGTRQWIERAKMRGKDIYLITGFRTLLNATLKTSNGGGRYGGATAHGPVGAFTGNPDDSLDVKGKVKVNSTKSHIASMLVPGEKVFAVQYLKIKFRPFSSDKMDSSYLAPHNRWIEMLIVRGEEAENDGLEAELVKDVDDGDDDTCDTF